MTQQCRCDTHTAASAGGTWRNCLLLTFLLLLPSANLRSDIPEDKLNIIFYQFLEESDDVYMEIVPGERFRLPLIRGYQVRIGYDTIEIIALTDREVVEPDGYIMPSGHVAQAYNLGRLSFIEYELRISFDHQTDRYFLTFRGDSVRIAPFRDEFTAIILP